MQLQITHNTTYTYDRPVAQGLQQIRLWPKTRAGQTVEQWDIELEGARYEASFEDQHNNIVWLTSIQPGTQKIVLRCSGTVVNENDSGIVGTHGGYAPLWYFKRDTALSAAGEKIRALIEDLQPEDNALNALHALSEAIVTRVPYVTGSTDASTTAEGALRTGAGVCQDHTHIMLAAARALGHPARYVSGYLMMNDRVAQDATHAWAEVHLDDIGWVGFDVSNGISPDSRYVRVATGLDATEAAPVRGIRTEANLFGNESAGNEFMSVDIQVQQ